MGFAYCFPIVFTTLLLWESSRSILGMRFGFSDSKILEWLTFRIWNLTTVTCRAAELTRIMKIGNKKYKDKASKLIYITDNYENGQNCESYGILNGWTIPKFANFGILDSLTNWKNSENLFNFQIVKLWKFINFPI